MSGEDYFFPPERLEGEGFVVRCYRPSDGPLLREATETSYSHLARWMPWARPESSAEESEQLVRRFRARWLLGEDFTLAIVDPSESRLLGGTGFHLASGSWRARNAEIGMWIRADAASAGLGTRVLGALLGWGFRDWPWERLFWRCDAENHASRRVAEKVGLRHEATLRGDDLDPAGRRRDTLVYARLRAES